jgi:PAS domain S-box-containing protein
LIDNLIFKKAPTILFIVSKDGSIIDLNQQATNFVGLDSSNCQTNKFIDFIEDKKNKLAKIFEEANQTNFPQLLEVKFKAKNHKSFHTMLSINISFNDEMNEQIFIISVFDLTHYKMQAELIRESQLRFENIANSAPVMIWITDVSGLFTFVNNIWSEFTNRTTGEELGLNWIQDVHLDDANYLISVYQKSIEERISFVHQFRFKRKDNVYRWLMMNGIPRFNESDFFLGFIGTCIDITQQKEDEDYIKKINDELENANQNKDKFFSIISHDLRSPLSGIMSLLDIIVSDYDSLEEEERKEILFEAAKTSKSTYTLMENLLDWSRIQTGKISYEPQNISITQILSGIKNLYYQKLKEKSLSLNYDFEPECFAFADNNMTETILRNLVSNAIKFSKESGIILISYDTLDDFIQVKVKDTGVGMDEKQLSKLFKLDQTHSTVGTSGERGTGLGLMLCKELVEKQGGKIWIESVLNSGTSFYFTLPKTK